MICERRHHISAYLFHFIAEPSVALFKSTKLDLQCCMHRPVNIVILRHHPYLVKLLAFVLSVLSLILKFAEVQSQSSVSQSTQRSQPQPPKVSAPPAKACSETNNNKAR
jgi:hypothetical protein